MDDSFDELDVPDNWLELGSKRRHEGSDWFFDKRIKPGHTPSSAADNLQENDPAVRSENHISLSLSGTLEDDSLNQPESQVTDCQRANKQTVEEEIQIIDCNAAEPNANNNLAILLDKESTQPTINIDNHVSLILSGTLEDDSLNQPESQSSDYQRQNKQNLAEEIQIIDCNAAQPNTNNNLLTLLDKDSNRPAVRFENHVSYRPSLSSTFEIDSLNQPESQPAGCQKPNNQILEEGIQIIDCNADQPNAANNLTNLLNNARNSPTVKPEDNSLNQPELQSTGGQSQNKLRKEIIPIDCDAVQPKASANNNLVTLLLDNFPTRTFENYTSYSLGSTLEDDSLNQPESQPTGWQTQNKHNLEEETPTIDFKAVQSRASANNNPATSSDKDGAFDNLFCVDDDVTFVAAEPGNVINLDLNNHLEKPSFAKINAQEQSMPNQKNELKKISSLVRDAKIISDIIPGRNFDEIYSALLDHRDKSNRLDIATVQLLEKTATPSQASSTDLFEEVQIVMSAVPHADANVVYTLLENLPPSSQRVNKVIANLGLAISTDAVPSNPKPALLKKASSVDDPVLKNDPLFLEMRTIARMFPEADRNEIYALLEASHNKSNRLQVVIDEIAGLNQLESQISASDSQEFALSAEDLFEQDLDTVKSIFPDCDPNYLYEKLESIKNEPNRTDLLVTELFDKKDYPKIKDIAKKAKAKEKEKEDLAYKEKVRKLDLTVEEFLERFPDPEKTFGDESTVKSNLYQDHAYAALRNEFRMLKAGYLKVTLIKHKSHFYPAYRQLSNEVLGIPLDQRYKFNNKFMKHARSYKIPMPAEADEYFYHEYWFVQNEQRVRDYPLQKEQEKRAKIEEAKAKGELFECGCCYDDECLFEEMTSCPEGHLFCKTCLVRSTEAAFGDMKTKFPCLSGDCDQNIPLSILQTVIPANLFSKIVRRMQEEEILQANIKDLVSCPFCPFATIMPNPDDKVFKCLNPECLKESCRLCQEPNHIPLRCNEVEKKAETDMRTFIENRISEAVMRKCHKCGKNFIKDIGCNKMQCYCGATSCYACKKPNIGYEHFSNNKECADTDPNLIHERDMKAAAAKAKQEYLEKHPEAASVELKTDVQDMIKDFVSSSSQVKNIPMIGPGGYLGRAYGGNW
ncbi:E3 ubiquitin-protein ligase [Plakobranchus ocellatus]|uniref:E3 ubiquitin-protein ligase n=1 Tax=Plakobranchus ocellatus TaxID=259542 RepID=A0AAV4ALW4_9GAST|nr:E3 ubiquitin-protein ligase [Plakobranchus ocellatus]